MGTTKTGLVPDEDTGTIFACISTAPGTSQERTAEVVKQVDKMLASNPAIATRNAIMGYSFIGGAGSNQGTIIVKLKPFEERPVDSSTVSRRLVQVAVSRRCLSTQWNILLYWV